MSVKPTSAPRNPQAAHRAAASSRAMVAQLGEANGQLRGAPGGATSGAWNKAQAIEAALDEARLTGEYGKVEKMLAGFKAYKLGNGYAPGINPTKGTSHRWFDDNAWVGLVFMQAHDQTGKPRYLT